MALKALTVSDTVDYVSDLDSAKTKTQVPVDPKDPKKGMKEVEVIEPGATIFKLKSLDVFLMGNIYDRASTLTGRQGEDTVGVQTHINQTNIDAVRHGLVGFENFLGENGEPIKFQTQKTVVGGRDYNIVSDVVLNRLGIRLIGELASKIKAISEVNSDDEKNSERA